MQLTISPDHNTVTVDGVAYVHDPKDKTCRCAFQENEEVCNNEDVKCFAVSRIRGNYKLKVTEE